MDRRRGNSYYPDYQNNQNVRGNETNSKFQDSKPRIQSRSNTQLSSVSRAFRSEDDSPSQSPHSPPPRHGDHNSTANKIQASLSKDPRKIRGPSEANGSVSEKPSLDMSNSSIADYILEVNRQVLYEERVREAEKKVKETKVNARQYKAIHPDSNPLSDYHAKQLKRDEDALSNLSQLLAESKDRVRKLPLITKDLLSDAIPISTELPVRDDLESMKSIMKDLEKKVEQLIKQNKEQEMELKEMKDKQSKPPSEPLEAKLTSKIIASQHGSDARFKAVEEKIRGFDERWILHAKVSIQQKDDLQKQKDEVKDLASRQVKVEGPLASLQTRVEKLDTKVSGKISRETPRSPPRDDFEEDIDEIKLQQKEQKRLIANLSNMFVSHQEYSEGFSQLETSTKLSEKLVQDAGKAQDNLSSKTSILVEKINQITSNIDQIKVDMKVSPTADDRISRLQGEVKQLTDIREHYLAFYEKTQEQLKQLIQLLKIGDDKFDETKEDLYSRLNSVSEVCQNNRKVTAEFSEHYKAKDQEHTQSIVDLHKKVKNCEDNGVSAFTQNAAVVTDMATLRTSIEQVSHSIMSLDTRFSAISTQNLYKSIVATIQPLLPHIYELKEQLQIARNAAVASAEKTTLLDGKVKAIEANEAETIGRVQALETNVTERASATPREGQESLQPGQFEALQGRLSTMEQLVHDQAQKLADGAPPLQGLTQLVTELKQNKIEFTTITDGLYEIRTTLEQTKNQMTVVEAWSEKEIKLVDSIQSRIRAVEADFTTQQERLIKIETTLNHVSKLEPRLDQLQDKIAGDQNGEKSLKELLTQVASGKEQLDETATEVVKIKNGLKDSKSGIDSLLQRVFELEVSMLPADDRYVVYTNLASRIDKAKFEERWRGCTIKELQFGGGKQPVTEVNTCYAIARIVSAPNMDPFLENASKEQKGEKWCGRVPVMCEIDPRTYNTIKWEKPFCVKKLLPELQNISNDRASMAPSTSTTARDISTKPSAEPTSNNMSQVSRSSVLPPKSSAISDDTELADSEDEYLLGKFGATRGGQPTRPSMSAPIRSSRPSTPLNREAMKRNAPDSGSSRNASKRGRLG